ncbi:ATP-binding protein [Ekhidna sp.]|uniref:ATP-binding protein n=1 Tax=Ekhidna sp. TaxID=2608089 RepID=UPI003CCC376D
MFRYLQLAFLLVLTSTSEVLANGDTWKNILSDKQGIVEFYWYPNNVIIENSRDIIDGIEHDLAISFIRFLEASHNVSIELRWIETDSFEEVIDKVKNGKGGTFGASSISITEQRSEYLNFTAPYMADVAVLISNSNLNVALSLDELKEVLDGNTAVSITNTTLVESLIKLKANLGVNFSIKYVKNSGDIIKRVSELENSFGYVDIANFLVAVDKNTNIKRQFFLPIKLEGLSIIYPKGSDWNKPVKDYFESQQFEEDRKRIIQKYLGANATEIIDRISKSAEMGPLEEIVISNREKEAQYERLLEAAKKDQDSVRLTIILISILIVVLVVLVLLYALYRIKSQNNDRLLEQQRLVEEANEQLRSLNEEKNNLIKVLAHDLRSPLSNILNGSQIVESNEKLSEQGQKLLGFIMDSSQKMSSMIDKILDVDAIETGRHNLKIEHIDIHETLQQIIKENETKANKKSIQIIANLQKDLIVEADKIYTAQVIDNLVSNAIKYSGENAKVEITCQPVGEMVRISVKDEGPGLTKEDEKKLFKKYQQLSARPTKGEMSIGLGLSIVKLFTELMGGQVSYETELGKGTSFHVYLKKGI